MDERRGGAKEIKGRGPAPKRGWRWTKPRAIKENKIDWVWTRQGD